MQCRNWTEWSIVQGVINPGNFKIGRGTRCVPYLKLQMQFIIHSINCTTQGVFSELLLNEKVCSAFHKFQLKTVRNIVIA